MKKLVLLLSLCLAAALSTPAAQTIVQHGNLHGTGGCSASPCTLDFSTQSAVTSGNALALFLFFQGTGCTGLVVSSITDNNSNTYSAAPGGAGSFTSLPRFATWCISLWYSCGISSSPNNKPTLTISFNNTVSASNVGFAEISSTKATSCADGGGTATCNTCGTANTDQNTSSWTTTQAHELIFSAGISDFGNTSQGTGFTCLDSGTGSSNPGCGVINAETDAFKLLTTTGTVTGIMQPTSSSDDMVIKAFSLIDSASSTTGIKHKSTIVGLHYQHKKSLREKRT